MLLTVRFIWAENVSFAVASALGNRSINVFPPAVNAWSLSCSNCDAYTSTLELGDVLVEEPLWAGINVHPVLFR